MNGRDIFSRIVAGSQISLLVAFLATLLSVTLGTVLGVTAGFFGGRVDTLISRAMDIFLAFPLLLFAIAIVGVIPDSADIGPFTLQDNNLRIAVLVFIIGFFNWPYIGRIIRGQTLSLREREFVDAARSLGATNRWIIRRELMPSLIAPILVYATLLIPTNILFEAALSFLGVGVSEPTGIVGRHAHACRRLLPDCSTVHDRPRHGHLHHGHVVQPVRRRAARRPGPTRSVAHTGRRAAFRETPREG